MLVRLLMLTGFALALFAYQASAAEVDVYGTFNYKLSHDENTSGVAYSKLEDNTSIMGIDVSSPLAVGMSGFAKLEVGVDTDDSGSDTLDSRLAYVGLKTSNGASISMGRQSHPFTNNIGGKTSIFNVYGSSADFNYGSRSSNSLGFSLGEGSAVSIDGLAILNGSAGQSDSF
ncbi:MAG: porin, partial [Chloroflexota bacterium]|nr:porin [Chloroflexota bacterium]